MPKVNGKEFPYTAAGRAAAERERARTNPGFAGRGNPAGNPGTAPQASNVGDLARQIMNKQRQNDTNMRAKGLRGRRTRSKGELMKGGYNITRNLGEKPDVGY